MCRLGVQVARGLRTTTPSPPRSKTLCRKASTWAAASSGNVEQLRLPVQVALRPWAVVQVGVEEPQLVLEGHARRHVREVVAQRPLRHGHALMPLGLASRRWRIHCSQAWKSIARTMLVFLISPVEKTLASGGLE